MPQDQKSLTVPLLSHTQPQPQTPRHIPLCEQALWAITATGKRLALIHIISRSGLFNHYWQDFLWTPHFLLRPALLYAVIFQLVGRLQCLLCNYGLIHNFEFTSELCFTAPLAAHYNTSCWKGSTCTQRATWMVSPCVSPAGLRRQVGVIYSTAQQFTILNT